MLLLFRDQSADGSFDPLSLGWDCYLDGDDVSVSGSDVTSWNDQSGNGNHFAQSVSANRPQLITSDAGFNSENTIEFDATADTGNGTWLESTEFMDGASAGECFFVLRSDSSNHGLYLIHEITDTSFHPWITDQLFHGFGSTTRKTIGEVLGTDSVHILNMRSAASDWSAHIDGSSIHSTGTNTVGWTTARGQHEIGRSWTTTVPWTGRIALFAMIGSILDSGDRADFLTYLQSRYGL